MGLDWAYFFFLCISMVHLLLDGFGIPLKFLQLVVFDSSFLLCASSILSSWIFMAVVLVEPLTVGNGFFKLLKFGNISAHAIELFRAVWGWIYLSICIAVYLLNGFTVVLPIGEPFLLFWLSLLGYINFIFWSETSKFYNFVLFGLY